MSTGGTPTLRGKVWTGDTSERWRETRPVTWKWSRVRGLSLRVRVRGLSDNTDEGDMNNKETGEPGSGGGRRGLPGIV
jgi:hypothetical protein